MSKSGDPKPPSIERPRCPFFVRVAGGILFAQGVLIYVGIFGWFCRFMTVPGAGGDLCIFSIICAVPALVAYVLTRSAMYLFTGIARDTLALGLVLAILGGVLFAGSAAIGGYYAFAMAATWDMELGGGLRPAQVVAIAVVFVVGSSWLGSGLLLLRSRNAYREYRRVRSIEAEPILPHTHHDEPRA